MSLAVCGLFIRCAGSCNTADWLPRFLTHCLPSYPAENKELNRLVSICMECSTAARVPLARPYQQFQSTEAFYGWDVSGRARYLFANVLVKATFFVFLAAPAGTRIVSAGFVLLNDGLLRRPSKIRDVAKVIGIPAIKVVFL